MCGICGVVGEEANRDYALEMVGGMSSMLAHRGPDGQGLTKGRGFVLAHRRLAVVDPAHGRQPVVSEDGRLHLVFNGEIYNHAELRAYLSKKGVEVKTRSDTEVLLKLLGLLGMECLELLNGMFAFAVYDSREQVFHAARDSLGIKPFYFLERPGASLAFASEIKAFLPCPGFSPEPDADALAQYLAFQFYLGENSLFRGVRRLAPGSFLSFESGRLKICSFPKRPASVSSPSSEPELCEELDSLLADTLRMQTHVDVPVGVYVSGGLDSSAVAAYASKFVPGLPAFCGRYAEGPEYDESRYAKSLARALRLNYREICGREEEFLSLQGRLAYVMDEPAAGPGIYGQYETARLAAETVRVTLSGLGGDEIFAGYVRYLIMLMEFGQDKRITGEGFPSAASIPRVLKGYEPMLARIRAKNTGNDPVRAYFNLVDRGSGLFTALNPGLSAQTGLAGIYERFRASFASGREETLLTRMLSFDRKTFLCSILQVEDRIAGALSLESRVPLLDNRIVELADRMPDDLKIRGGILKYALRRAAGTHIPEAIADRPDKMGFPIPLDVWLRGETGKFIRDFFGARDMEGDGLLNKPAVMELLNSGSLSPRAVWGLLSLELWNRVFMRGGYREYL